MFVAVNQKNHMINILDLVIAKPAAAKIGRENYYCPVCKKKVILKNGTIRMTHFAHKQNSDCLGLSEGETSEHLEAKAMIYQWDANNCQLEASLPELSQRPDILFRNDLAIEIQCSPLNGQRFIERVNGYRKASYQQWWLVGAKYLVHSRLTQSGKKFCYFNPKIGFYFWSLDRVSQRIFLHYHVQESWDRQQRWKTKTFEWKKFDLKEIFTVPQKAAIFHSWYYSNQESKLYQEQLAKKLIQKEPKLLAVQGAFYQRHCHLLMLSKELYLPSDFYFYFGDWLIFFRFLIFQKMKQQNYCFSEKLAKELADEIDVFQKETSLPLADHTEILKCFIIETISLLNQKERKPEKKAENLQWRNFITQIPIRNMIR